ncbi:hypothetical protein [Natranaerofaba carboxydovora]|uniref:hypothetical protein n=1 Tax=Natranaerofaba carboxydovora TaxID=2742683 RepID=UPI001F13C551|nr:hypothetical protein [Natranaerofaba carboxydovora]
MDPLFVLIVILAILAAQMIIGTKKHVNNQMEIAKQANELRKEQVDLLKEILNELKNNDNK